MISALLSDLDGTLLDSEPVHREAWIAIGKEYGIMLTHGMLLPYRGMPTREFAFKVLPPALHARVDEIVAKKDKYYFQRFSSLRLFPGVEAMSRALKRAGIPFWICTSSKAYTIDRLFEQTRLRKILPRDCIVAREQYVRGKPEPESLLVSAEKMHLPVKDILFFGDAWNDYAAAVAAHMPFLLYLALNMKRDERIPAHIPAVARHRDVPGFLKSHS